MKQYVPFRLVTEGPSADELGYLTAELHARWVCEKLRQQSCQKQALLEAVVLKAGEASKKEPV